ncbi:MAG TPA: hypothetical protein VF657_16715 [Actinoplanes sp.]|jgi:hypothetical protein
MTIEASAGRTRSVWHPVVVAGVVLAATTGMSVAAGIGRDSTWLILGLWMCTGVACGFAASGST